MNINTLRWIGFGMMQLAILIILIVLQFLPVTGRHLLWASLGWGFSEFFVIELIMWGLYLGSLRPRYYND